MGIYDFGGLKSYTGLKVYEIIFEKLLKYFHICHIHPVNNCEKFSFKKQNDTRYGIYTYK